MNEQPNWRSAAERTQTRIETLRADGRAPVVNQHVVSRVLLKRFAAHAGSAGHQVYSFDLDRPTNRHRTRSIKTCGTVPDFVPFASASLEEVWSRVENLLPAAADAVERGDIFEHEEYVLVLKDFIALHWARSLHYRALHDQIFAALYERQRTKLLTVHADLLRADYLKHSGEHVADPQTLAMWAEDLMRTVRDDELSGYNLRIGIEEMFHKTRAAIRESCLEILIPASGQFLIGDTPALTVRRDGSTLTYCMALGDSNAIVLPLGPHHLLVGRSPHDVLAPIPTTMVNELNGLQIEAARSRVYLHPGSGLERFVLAHLAAGGRAGRTPVPPPRRPAADTPAARPSDPAP
ncbi:DUF4238 domain-containing protein [Kitasatospora paranensis]|uniref:DUF4238 domain-containing protein n=1 Tax=Kitasatospora paranensis TaxID=258053 RepID=A0ABW2G4I4_9ACTN